MNKRKIILDVDTGTDDAVAIMLAALSNKFDILGITVTWGNQNVEDCVQNTINVLHHINHDEINIYQGQSQCLNPEKRKEIEKIYPPHPIYYFDENNIEHHLHPKRLSIPEFNKPIEKETAVDFLINTIINSKEKVTIVPVGPTTNISSAIKKCPEIVNNIDEIVFMGGSLYTGNVTKTAEANFYNDPDSIKIILDSNVNCTLIALDATSSVSFSMKDADFLESLNTNSSKLTGQIIKLRADVSKYLGWHDGEHELIHDALAVAYLIDSTVITKWDYEPIDIVTDISEKYGSLYIKEGNHKAKIAITADKEKYFNLLINTLKN